MEERLLKLGFWQFLPMGNGKAAAPSKTEKASSSVQEQAGVHPYPDWTVMQAYYGPGIAMPPPYFGTAVTSGHAPSYVWGPQPLMPPFGAPFPAMYPHGGVYAHPSVPLGVQAVVTSTASEAAKLTQETPVKSPSNKDHGLTKKLRGHDGLSMTVCNGKDKNEAGDTAYTQSQSTEGGIDGSSDGSDGNSNQSQKKRALDDTAAGKPVATSSVPGLADRVSTAAKAKFSAPVSLPNGAVAPNGDGDVRELKRERRKQSNRESARRSRLRKQAETEELALKVETLRVENLNLKSEISRLSENSAKLRQENSVLMEKLNNVQQGLSLDRSSDKVEDQTSPSAGIENFLSKINEPTTVSRSEQQDNETRDNAGKLHQLLETSPRADAAIAV
ncbi:hypothetical protein Taro_007529 [Colocasia esculenta]|uniref:BZIP domain-containing protein n=1 Tax=Colocasia esculenta TaxID=4460 RepID=A0A843TYD8_COLES|nr:hypothetical protein [Colocasia esculenta]